MKSYNEMYLENMDELSQLIKHEQEYEEELSLAEKSSKEEIAKKEAELKEKLLKESVLTEAEKAGILAEKEEKIKKIEEDAKQKLELKLKELERADKDKALNYINKSLLGD